MEKKTFIVNRGIAYDVFNTLSVKDAGPPYQAVNLIILFQQLLSEV